MKPLFKTLVPLILFSAIFLSGCSGELPFSNTPTPTITNTPSPTNTSTPSPTATQTPTPTVTPTSTPIGGGSGKILFTYAREGFEGVFPDLEGQLNVFIANLDGSNLVPITDGLRGYNYIEALSTDGSKALISSFRSQNRSDDPNAILYLFDLSTVEKEPIQIVQGFSQHSYNPAAGWTNDSKIVYLGKGEKGYGIYVANPDGSEPTKIDATVKTPERILSIDDQRIYWSSGVYKNYGVNYGDYTAVWWTNLDASAQEKLEVEDRQVEFFAMEYDFSPDGKRLAWIPSAPEPECDTIVKIKQLNEELSIPEYAEKCRLLYVADLANPNNPIKISLAYPLVPSDQYYEKYEYMIAGFDKVLWNPNGVELFGLFRGMLRYGWNPPKIYSINISDKKVEPIREFPSLHDYDMGDKQFGSWSVPRIYAFSSDGRLMLVSKITTEETRRFALVDIETMSLDTTFLSGLNHDELKDVFLLPK